jgi:hypothetical protein
MSQPMKMNSTVNYLNGDEDAMGGDHGLHDENLNDDRVNQEPTQGNMMRFICHVTNLTKTRLNK